MSARPPLEEILETATRFRDTTVEEIVRYALELEERLKKADALAEIGQGGDALRALDALQAIRRLVEDRSDG